MKTFQPPATASHSRVEVNGNFNSPVTRRLLDYWSGLCGGSSRPRFRDFDLMAVYDIAPMLAIRDMIDGGRDFGCRFWGTKLVESFGHDATGKRLSECYPPESVEIIRRRMMLAIEQEHPVRCAGVFDFLDSVLPKTYEAIWLGLEDDGGDVTYAITAIDIGYELTEEDMAPANMGGVLEAIVYK